jgi:hypothetical protein
MQDFNIGDTVYLKNETTSICNGQTEIFPEGAKCTVEDTLFDGDIMINCGGQTLWLPEDDVTDKPLSGLVSDLEFEYGNG